MRFLTAAWRHLAIVTFRVPDEVLAPRLPVGTEPDRWEGSALASLVAFEFQETAVLGVPVPLHGDFPEWNLRFYVREREGARRAGVAFVAELVPKPFLAFAARFFYGEPYRAVPYAFEKHRVGESLSLAHAVTVGGRTHRFNYIAGGAPRTPAEDSLATFLAQRGWGFGPPGGSSQRCYRVTHPAWGVYPETRFDLDADFAALYGKEWAFLNDAPPLSRFVADGSRVEVSWKARTAPTS
jgi:uncharacterized protein YqjF (DUF2071 family)